MSVEIVRCTVDDLPRLRELAHTTFVAAFGAANTPENMAAYLEKSLSDAVLRRSLEHPESRFYFLWAQGRLMGYCKLNVGGAQTEGQAEDALEIERVYVVPEGQGKGLGMRFLQHAEAVAQQLGKRRVWLGVWSENHGAIRFYQRGGYRRVGEHTFLLGNEEQTDWIMEKAL